MACYDILTALIVESYRRDDWGLRKVTTWFAVNICGLSRMLCPLRFQKETLTLLSLGSVSIKLLVGVTTGHCMMARMAEHLGYSGNDLYRRCLDDEKEEESFKHLYALQRRRLLWLGRRNSHILEGLNYVPLMSLLRFMKSTDWVNWKQDETVFGFRK